MVYALLFEDNDEFADQRAKHMSAHLYFLESNTDTIISAGPMHDRLQHQSAGGLWIVEAKDQRSVQELIEADPFWPTGLRKQVRILEWTQVFVNRKRQV